MHVLDDFGGLTPRARRFLSRAAWREKPRVPTETAKFRVNRGTPLDPAPPALVKASARFNERYSGLRYEPGKLAERARAEDYPRVWMFDMDFDVAPEGSGWTFDWDGEAVSSPCNYLGHTDGRVGVNFSRGFQEIAASFDHLIEQHALEDELAAWGRGRSSADGWPDLPSVLDGLSPVPAASGPAGGWWLSKTVAVETFLGYTNHTDPRPPRTWIYTRDDAAEARVKKALAALAERRPGAR